MVLPLIVVKETFYSRLSDGLFYNLDLDWIHLAQNAEQWKALVHRVMNLQFSQNVGKF
jgi:hypothetical protein